MHRPHRPQNLANLRDNTTSPRREWFPSGLAGDAFNQRCSAGARRVRTVSRGGRIPRGACRLADKPLERDAASSPLQGLRVRERRGMGRGRRGRSLRPFPVSQHHPSPTRLFPESPTSRRERGPGGRPAGRLGLCGSVLAGGGEAGRRPSAGA